MPATSSSPAGAQQLEKHLIDVIIYTASLASQPRAVESIMDKLRIITAQNKLTYTDAEEQTLHEIQQGLNTYLTQDEPIRRFDAESLNLHINAHFEGRKRRHVLTWYLLGVILLAIALSVGSTFLPLPLSAQAKPTLAVTIIYAVFYFSAGLFFLRATKQLTPTARHAYLYICLAMTSLGVAVFAQPITGLASLQHNPFMPTVITVPLAAAYIVLYIGAGKVGRLTDPSVHVPSRPFIISVIALVAAAIVLPIYLAPALHHVLSAPYITGPIIFQGVATLCLIAAGRILHTTRQHLSPPYAKAMRALQTAMVVNIPTSGYFVGYWLLNGQLSTNNYLRLGVIALLATALLYLRAGYRFNKMHSYEL